MRYAALLGAILLCGCSDDVEQELSACLNSTEPTILLRQIAMPADQREKFDSCLKSALSGPGLMQPLPFCRSLYLNAEQLVRTCMRAHGYSYKNLHDITVSSCSFGNYDDATCYGPTWYVEIEATVQKLLKE